MITLMLADSTSSWGIPDIDSSIGEEADDLEDLVYVNPTPVMSGGAIIGVWLDQLKKSNAATEGVCPYGRRARGSSNQTCPCRPGFGPVRDPLFRSHRCAIQNRTGPVDEALAAEFVQDRVVQPPP
jgi:hypothetical protein